MTTTFLERLGAQDAEGLGELFAEEINWFVPGNPALTPWAGKRSRKSEVPEYFRALWAAVESGKIVVSAEAVVTDGDNAVIFAVFDHVAAPAGRPFHTDVALRLTVTDGKIARMYLFEDGAGCVSMGWLASTRLRRWARQWWTGNPYTVGSRYMTRPAWYRTSFRNSPSAEKPVSSQQYIRMVPSIRLTIV